VKVVPITASSVEETVQEIGKKLKTTFTKLILVTEREPTACQGKVTKMYQSFKG